MKKSILTSVGLLLLALLVMSGAAAAQGQQQSGQQAPAPVQISPEEQEALKKISETTDLPQRLALVEEFLAKYPESVLRGRVYLAGAEAHRMQNNLAKTVEYGERALEVDPRDPFSMILVAEALAEGAVPLQTDYEEKLTKAEDYARRALEILPEFFASIPPRPDMPQEELDRRKHYVEAQPHATLGFVYLRRNQNDQAEQELKLATDLNQLRPNAADFQRLGFAHMRQKEYAEAVAAFQRCAEIGGGAAGPCQKQIEGLQPLLKVQPPAEEKKPQE